MFSDELIGLDIAHKREMRRSTATAQGMIDEQAAHVARLQSKLAAAYAELDAERGKRRAAELKLQRVLSMKLH